MSGKKDLKNMTPPSENAENPVKTENGAYAEKLSSSESAEPKAAAETVEKINSGILANDASAPSQNSEETVNDADTYAEEYEIGADWDAADFGEFTNSKRVARVNAEMRRRSKSNFSKDILKCVLVLTVIAVVSGALLGVLNWLTWVDPDTKIISEVAEAVGVGPENVSKNASRIVNESGSKNTIKGVYEVKKDGVVQTLVYYASGSGAKSGTLELLVYVSADGVIENITVYSQSETAGYFEKVEKTNRAKYVGINITGLKIFTLVKDGPADSSEISRVSGATFTSRGYNNAINAVVYAYNHYAGEDA